MGKVIVWIVRHGDKTETKAGNPFLNAPGLVRSLQLYMAFANASKDGHVVGIMAAVCGQGYNSYRPFQTVMPTANAMQKPIHDAYTPWQFDEAALLIKSLATEWLGTNKDMEGHFLVAWEHRSITDLLTAVGALTGTEAEEFWPATDFDSIARFTISPPYADPNTKLPSKTEMQIGHVRLLNNAYPLPIALKSKNGKGFQQLKWNELFNVINGLAVDTQPQTQTASASKVKFNDDDLDYLLVGSKRNRDGRYNPM